MKQETWNDILRAMIAVRDAHGWREETLGETPRRATGTSIEARKPVAQSGRQKAKRVTNTKKAKAKIKKKSSLKIRKKVGKKSARKPSKRLAAKPARRSKAGK